MSAKAEGAPDKGADGPRPEDLLVEVQDRARRAYESLDPLAERLLYRLPVPGGERQSHPMVLVLGSHSAGKSTFINYLLGRDVQQTGVAPTDDGFTILAAGDSDEDRDGHAALGTPELGLGDLRRFGPVLQAHLKLKLRAGCPLLQRLWLVDTPGMIDAADAAEAAAEDSADGKPAGGPADRRDASPYGRNVGSRGYDFLGVLRWLAERADVVLLLFDPQKPGTTGETLRALTQSLAHLEHKLLIVLNKADEFRSVQDFARAYGALCWNLAKVIPRKDLPRIYTCYVPAPGRGGGEGLPVSDFDSGREEILAEVRRAPERRLDNVITRLHDDARDVLLYAQVAGAVRAETGGRRWRWRLRGLAAGLAGAVTTALLVFGQQSLGWAVQWPLIVAPATVGLLLTIALWAFGESLARKRAAELLADLTPVFERLHRPALAVADAGDLRALWARLHGPLRKALETLGGERLPRVPRRQLRAIEEILEREIPRLRGEIYDRGGPEGGR